MLNSFGTVDSVDQDPKHCFTLYHPICTSTDVLPHLSPSLDVSMLSHSEDTLMLQCQEFH